MGKNLIQQARGKGGPTYRAPSFRYKGAARVLYGTKTAKITDLIKCPGHSAPLLEVVYDNGEKGFMIASEGIRIGDEVKLGNDAELKLGNFMFLKDIPEGTSVFNIESVPGDGGKYIRTSGGFGKIILRTEKEVVVQLPSKKSHSFHPNCKATIGVAAAGGRKEKPFVKAGNRFWYMKARNKLYPVMSGSAQNAVDHPFGNKRSSRKSKARPAPKNAPPGRNVGMLHPRRTGRQKGKAVVKE